MRRLILLTFLVLVGCGGSSAVVPATSSGTSVTSATTKASFTITVPSHSAQVKSRKPQYVSAQTESAVVTLASVNGSAFTGSQAITAVNLTTSSPACSGSPLTCTITVPAAVGSDAFTLSTYDAQQTSTSPTTPAGNLLSTATVTINVVAGQTNTPSTALVLNGVPASITATFATDTNTSAHVSGSATSGFSIVGNRPYTLTLSAQDASGETIVGDGAPTFSSGSSAVVLTQVNATTYTVQVKSYGATPVTVLASTPSGSPLGFTVTTDQELWVANSGAFPTNGDVTAYGLVTTSSQITATQIATDTITAGLSQPVGLAFDASGNLWVSDATNNTVTKYVPGTNTVSATIGTGGGSDPGGLAFDANGNLWVALANSISEYIGTTATGTTINTGVNITPTGLAFDTSGKLWVTFYSPTDAATAYSGTTATSLSINTGINPEGLAFDASGDLWVANLNSGNVTEYKSPLSSSSSAAATISSSLTEPIGLAFDATGNLYVSDYNNNKVYAYAPGGTTPISGTPISVGALPGFIAITP